jgi:hypothetical protein
MSVVHLATSSHRVGQAFRESIQRHADEVVVSELGRCDDEWRSAVSSLREAAAGLERACEGTAGRDRTIPSSAVAALVERIIAMTTDEADRAVEHAQAEVRAQLGQAQALAQRLEAELGAARDELAQSRTRFEAEHAVRARLEAESVDARTRYEQAIAERESDIRRQTTELDARRQECGTLSQQLEAAHARNDSLRGVLQAIYGHVERAVVSVRSAAPDATGGAAGGDDSPDARAATAPLQPAAGFQAAILGAGGGPVAHPVEAGSGAQPETALASYVASLLDTVEAGYRKDLESGLVPLDIVQRLSSSLRQARDMAAQRADRSQPLEVSLFETAVMRLVDARGGTPFGRHLAIAAFELFLPRSS